MTEFLNISKMDDKLHIERYPNAIALKRIDGPIERQLQDITLHANDLSFCSEACAQIRDLDRDKHRFLLKALFIASIARYFKCFGDSESRAQLSPGKVLKNHPGAEKVFEYFLDLRRKHIIHDENAYSQALIGIVLNPKDAPAKIADVVSTAVTVLTLDDAHLQQFSNLVAVSHEWVSAKRDELHRILAQKYERMRFEDLLALDDVKYTVPSTSQVHLKR